jgi:hypothetical protein
MEAYLEKMKAAINSIQTELEGTIKHRVEDILTSIDWQSQSLLEELHTGYTNAPG